MRRRLIAALAIAAAVAVLAEHPGLAQQGQLPLPPGGFKPPPPPPIKPYQTVPVTPPPTLNDGALRTVNRKSRYFRNRRRTSCMTSRWL